jgi:Fe-S-cluster containining protein
MAERDQWWAEGVQFECQGSGKCCTSRGEYGFVYLTDEDRVRLADHLGISEKNLVAEFCEETEGLLHLKDPDKDCQFLEDKRCGIYEGRPTQCRTWPFWPENMDARSWAKVAEFCPGVGKGRTWSRDEIQAEIDRSEDEDEYVGQAD